MQHDFRFPGESKISGRIEGVQARARRVTRGGGGPASADRTRRGETSESPPSVAPSSTITPSKRGTPSRIALDRSRSRSCSKATRTRCSATASWWSRPSTVCPSWGRAHRAPRSSTRSTAPFPTSPSESTSPSPPRHRSRSSLATARAAADAAPSCSRRPIPATTATTAQRTRTAISGRWQRCSSKETTGSTIFWSSELFFAGGEQGQGPRHVDFMWPIWLVFDRTPADRGTDWEPRLDYR